MTDALTTKAVNKSESEFTKPGTFYGVGVGPGDPGLITVKALRLIQNSPVVSYLVNDQGHSQGNAIAQAAIAEDNAPVVPEQQHIAITMPMLTERRLANDAYDEGARQISEQLEQGYDVVFLCEGDPLFFGSFSYLLERLQDQYTCHVVPGISSVNAAASALVKPLTMLTESFVVMSGRHSDQQILQALNEHDSVVIMKAGQARPRILSLLATAGRTQDAQYLEYIGRDNERIEQDVTELEVEAGPYFSLFVVLRSERSSR
ncbi:precorrin-2 C(20)-methyltransferase [Amphritea balenae]|uniref:Precorrin-2 C(20)-methyltransferase n=1 Tax=Amphritea balenae TaxID=452629 RepID=A0A3P1SU32_9GAMM|nr:precorrin-2 C(20)-methyltransferase [Amphritea balenae]RRD00727.1 precorrin-2 C(20)-methyltransferase [Amphritea balenae]GGK68288.1 precorrin-2 C(20)-methyltransferase [Amphritea balenae]